MDVLVALVPSAGVLLLFALAIRAMVQADRRERAAQALTERRVPPSAPRSPDESDTGPEEIPTASVAEVRADPES